MAKIKFIEDGNFTRWVRLLLIVAGFAIFYFTIKYIKPSIWSGILLLVGFGVALVGGMTSRAALHHLKPFDNSYEKARKSYEAPDTDGEANGDSSGKKK